MYCATYCIGADEIGRQDEDSLEEARQAIRKEA